MNRLNTVVNGGWPLTLDDLRWNGKGLFQALEGLTSMFGPNYVLSGAGLVSLGGNMVTNQAGFVVLNGEILYLPVPNAGWDEVALPYSYIALNVTYDASGIKKLFSGAQFNNGYEVRQAVINSYAEPQTGMVLFSSLQPVGQIIATMIESSPLSFEQGISNAFGGSTALAANQTALQCLAGSGNLYSVDITLGTVPLTSFAQKFPTGTFFAVYFTGPINTLITLADGAGGRMPFNTQGKSYAFKPNECAFFIATPDGKALLVNGTRSSDTWHYVGGGGGAPAYNLKYNGTMRFVIDKAGYVTLEGKVVTTAGNSGFVAFTLPAGYWPDRTWNFVATCDGSGNAIHIEIDQFGNVTAPNDWNNASHDNFYLNCIFRTNTP